jgi:hypothetical protein
MLVTQRLNGLLLLKNLKKKTARKKSRKFGRTSQIRTGDLYHVKAPTTLGATVKHANHSLLQTFG